MMRVALLTTALGLLTAPLGIAQTPSSGATGKVALYSAVGSELTQYIVDIDNGALVRQGSVTLPAAVQEAWTHSSRRFIYITWSSGGPGATGTQHGVTAFRIDPATGVLQPHGQPIPLASRAIYMTGDTTASHLIVAHNDPSEATVHRIEADGTLGAQVHQPAKLDFGIYAHQVRMDPSNQMVIVVTRGNGPTPTKAEDPGALKVFGYKDGILSNRASVAQGGGYGFQSRHVEFHPTRPWVFLVLERQNKLLVYQRLDGPTLGPTPLFTRDTLVDPSHLAGQATSSIHIHPNGRFLYVGNRASGTTEFQGKTVFAGGENSIAVYAINEDTGEPTLIQNADTHGIHPRTFALDPSGRMLIVGNANQLLVRDPARGGEQVRTVTGNLSMFRVGSDGKLTFVRKYDQNTDGGKTLFWMGMVGLP